MALHLRSIDKDLDVSSYLTLPLRTEAEVRAARLERATREFVQRYPQVARRMADGADGQRYFAQGYIGAAMESYSDE